MNGLSAPIIALISAGLLFYSFQAQVRANKLLQGQWQFDTFLSMFKDMLSTFNDLGFSYISGSNSDSGEHEILTVKGKMVFKKIVKIDYNLIDPKSKKDFFIDLVAYLFELNILIERSKQIKSESLYLKSKIVRFYRYNLGPLFDLFIKDLENHEPKSAYHLIKTAKMVQTNMKSIHYFEFAFQRQEGLERKTNEHE